MVVKDAHRPRFDLEEANGFAENRARLRPSVLAYVCDVDPGFGLFQPVLDDPAGYVANGGSATVVLFGALLELLLIITNIGTAVVIYPIVRRQNHVLALGYVTARIVECTFILVGILAVLSIVTLSQQNAGGDEGAIAYTLAALKDWTFILGPGFIVGWGNGLILGYLMYAPPGSCHGP